MSVFTSNPGSIAVHQSGWLELPGGGAITKLPMWDRDHNIFARNGHGQGATVLDSMGARLPTKKQYDKLRKTEGGIYIAPYTLPTSAMLDAARVPRPRVDKDGRDTAAMRRYRAANMSSLEWAKLHDVEVFQRLAAALWTNESVFNAGKHWTREGWIYGWELPDGTLIQNPYAGHGPNHPDYGSTFHGYSHGGPSHQWSEGLNLVGLPIGMRSVAWLGFQSALGIEEIAGSNHDSRILAYSRHCRRKGTFMGVDKWGSALWAGGHSLALQRDEDPWCAALASEGLRCVLLPGEAPPHGLRVSVRELCEDAAIAGTLITDKVIGPHPGWLAILGRRGESPLHGGRGHVRCVYQNEGSHYRAIGGNESNKIGVGLHASADVLAWIAR